MLGILSLWDRSDPSPSLKARLQHQPIRDGLRGANERDYIGKGKYIATGRGKSWSGKAKTLSEADRERIMLVSEIGTRAC